MDVILRDLDLVEHWTARAEQGEFEVDALLGYLAGIPTYSLCAERASCRLLRGSLPAAAPFPPKLAAAAPPWWRFRRSFSLDYARMHARRGNVVGATGQAAKAMLEEAHAIACPRAPRTALASAVIASPAIDEMPLPRTFPPMQTG